MAVALVHGVNAHITCGHPGDARKGGACHAISDILHQPGRSPTKIHCHQNLPPHHITIAASIASESETGSPHGAVMLTNLMPSKEAMHRRIQKGLVGDNKCVCRVSA